MNSYDIAVIGGDGTGPEVTAENIKVLDAAGQKFGFKLNYTDFDFGGDRYLRTNEVLPDSASDDLRNFPAVILGAIGHPDVAPGVLEKGILLRLRFELEQYINLRPVKLFDERFCPLKDKKPEDVDFVVVRENNEGLYTGSGGFVFKGTPNEVAIQESVNTRRGVERCLRYAFEYTQKRNKDKQLTLCGKTNVLTYAFDLWDRAFHEIGEADYHPFGSLGREVAPQDEAVILASEDALARISLDGIEAVSAPLTMVQRLGEHVLRGRSVQVTVWRVSAGVDPLWVGMPRASVEKAG
mgnify:CR=1 FL=1